MTRPSVEDMAWRGHSHGSERKCGPDCFSHTVGDAGSPFCKECSAMAEEYVWPCLLGSTNFGALQAASGARDEARETVERVRAALRSAEAHRGSYAFSLFMDEDDGSGEPKVALVGTRVIWAALDGTP